MANSRGIGFDFLGYRFEPLGDGTPIGSHGFLGIGSISFRIFLIRVARAQLEQYVPVLRIWPYEVEQSRYIRQR